MRAIQIKAKGGLEHLQLVEIADPGQPGPGAIRVALHAASLNFHDYAVCMGWMGGGPDRVPMADGAGVVEAVGEGVTEFAPGDRVVSVFTPDWLSGLPDRVSFGRVPGDGIDGYACEAVVVPQHFFTHAPAGWSHAEAATIPTAGVTAWRALAVDGHLKAGDTVLTLGTGGVSIWALQLAKAFGARVISTSSSDAKLEKLRALGASDVINYKAVPDWGAKVMELTGGRGADHVLETAGGSTLAQSVAAVAMGGQVSMIGVITGQEGTVPVSLLMFRKASIKGITVGSRADQLSFVRALETSGIRPIIDRSFPLEAIADAFAYEGAGKHFGKIVLEW